MPDDISDIAAYYNSDPLREHERLARHQLEHELTWRYLTEYMPPQGKVLEIGAATGKYTVELAKRGYAVTAVDMSAALLAECRQNLANAGLERRAVLVVADARDLSQVQESGFDVLLMMGPLYHLVEETDRKAALRQAAGKLRKGGLIFSAFISRLGIMGDLIKDIPNWVENPIEVRAHLENGRRSDQAPRGGFRGYFATVPEIAPLHEAAGFETLVVAGVEPAISADDESYNRLEGNIRQAWFDLLYEISTDPSIVGASRHLLYIGRRV